MADVNVFVFDGANNKYESLTKEEILAAIQQAVSTHEITDVDTGFVTKIKEQNQNKQLQFWVGKQAEYTALPTKDENTFYIVTDDSSFDDIADAVNQMQADVETIQDTFATLQAAEQTDAENISGLLSDVTSINVFVEQLIERKTIEFYSDGDESQTTVGSLTFSRVGNIANLQGTITGFTFASPYNRNLRAKNLPDYMAVNNSVFAVNKAQYTVDSVSHNEMLSCTWQDTMLSQTRVTRLMLGNIAGSATNITVDVNITYPVDLG